MIKKFILVLVLFVYSFNTAKAAEDFNEYLKNLKNNVNKQWDSPAYRTKYTSDIYFKIYSDGQTADTKLVKSSTINQMDKSALSAIASIQQFEKLPSFYTSDYIEVILSFSNPVNRYITKTSYTKKKKKVTRTNVIPVSTKSVKVKKVIYSESFECNSNYEDNMKNLILNLDIQKAKRN